jgi:LmbE family N-acetylglucosaminyl deacetylase
VTHVFVSPHPDDAALSCGGLIARLHERGEAIAIVTLFSGAGSGHRLTAYQRLALGFGSQEKWRPGDYAPESEAADSVPTPEQVMGVRRAEDESFARLAGASVVFVNLPDAVFRDYQGDAELMGAPRQDDPPPTVELRAALDALAPATLYLPLSVGGPVDHRAARRAGMALLAEPGWPYRDRTLFYEDFPYSHTTGFDRLDQLDPEVVTSLPAGATLTPEYISIGGVIDRKLAGLRVYASQHGRLFGGDDPMTRDVRDHAARVGRLGGVEAAERYWRVTTNGTGSGGVNS